MTLTQITTNGIKDSTIVTADIADSAITGAKLAKPVDLSEDEKIRLGADSDLQLYHQTGTPGISHIKSHTTADLEIGKYGTAAGNVYVKFGSDNSAIFKKDEAVELYYDNSKKFETSSSGVTVTGNVDITGSIGLADSEKTTFGAGTDLQIYHDGTTNRIDAVSGNLHIKGSNLSLKSYADETYLDATANGAVEIFYDNSKKLETTSGGIIVTGEVGVGGSAGTSGQVLTSGGSGAAATWATPSGGAWQHVSGQSDPNNRYVSFTGLTNSNICMYKFVLTGIRLGSSGTSSGEFGIKFGTADIGGYTSDSHYDTVGHYWQYNQSSPTNKNYNASYVRPCFGENGNGYDGIIYLAVPQTNVDSEDGNKFCWGQISHNDGYQEFKCRIGGPHTSSELREHTIDRVQFYGTHSSYIIRYGRIDLYKLTF